MYPVNFNQSPVHIAFTEAQAVPPTDFCCFDHRAYQVILGAFKASKQDFDFLIAPHILMIPFIFSYKTFSVCFAAAQSKKMYVVYYIYINADTHTSKFNKEKKNKKKKIKMCLVACL